MIIDINSLNVGDKIDKINFKNKIEIEYFKSSNVEEKKKALNIIKNNDMLQYHYFAQEYTVVKNASYIALMSIKYNNMRMYIGFISASSPSKNKKLRSNYYGAHMLPYSYSLKRGLKSYVMARVVLLPSYRGLGLGGYFIDNMVQYMKKTPDFFYMEIVSAMFHNYYFGGSVFDKTFIDLKNIMTEKEYDDYFVGVQSIANVEPSEKSRSNVPGFKGFSKRIGNVAFVFNKSHNEILQDWYKKLYNIDVDFEMNNTLLSEDVILAAELKFPIVFLKHTNLKPQILQGNIECLKTYLIKEDVEHELWN
jgi:hypothetical protein